MRKRKGQNITKKNMEMPLPSTPSKEAREDFAKV